LQTFKTQQGEWLTYLASISLIEEVTTRDGNNQNTNTLISILILVKLLPNVFFLPIGGILADSYDRRRIQIALDLSARAWWWYFYGPFPASLFVFAWWRISSSRPPVDCISQAT
jgi:dTMP kinase